MSDSFEPSLGMRFAPGHATDLTTSLAAYERRLPEMRELRSRDLRGTNFDAEDVLSRVFRAVDKLKGLRSDIEDLPHVAHALIEALPDYALAAMEAQARYASADVSAGELVALNARALALRRTFRDSAEPLVLHDLVDVERVAAFEGRVGYENVARELGDWAELIREAWPRIEGKTTLTMADVFQAKSIVAGMLRALQAGDRAVVSARDAAQMRRRAFTLLFRSYDEAQRAVVFLRWQEGDVDELTPSLFGHRKRRPRRTGREASV